MYLIGSLLGIYKDIAPSRHEHWSALAPLPFEVVISAAQKPEDSWQTGLVLDSPPTFSQKT